MDGAGSSVAAECRVTGSRGLRWRSDPSRAAALAPRNLVALVTANQRGAECHSASTAEAVRKECGSSSEAVRKSCGGSAEAVRKSCEKLRR